MQRAAALHLADEVHLPAPTAAKSPTSSRAAQLCGQNGQFDVQTYQTFRDNLKAIPA